MDRRSSTRLPIVIQALIYTPAAAEAGRDLPAQELPVALGRVIDLSRNGLLLQTGLQGLESGMRLELDLLLRNAGIDGHARCRAIVRRRTAGGYALAVDPQCAFSCQTLSLLHRRYLGATGFDLPAPAAAVRYWQGAHATTAA